MATADLSAPAAIAAPRPGDLLPGPVASGGIAFGAVVVVGVGVSLGVAAGIGALIAAGIALVTLLNPRFGAYVIVGVAPVTSGLVRGLPVPGFRVSEVAIGGLGFLILLTRQRRAPLKWGAFEWSVLLYCLATALLGGFDLIERGEGFTFGDIGSLLGPFQFLLLYVAVASALVDAGSRVMAMRILFFASVPVAILAMLQQLNIGSTRPFLVRVTGANYYEVVAALPGTGGVARATGPFNHWHQLGGYLAIIVLLGVMLLLDRRVAVLRRRWLLPILALASVALIETATITTIGIAIVGSVALAAWYGQLGRAFVRMVPLALVAGVAFAPLIVKRYENQFAVTTGSGRNSFVPETLAFRWETWTHQWIPLLQDRWLSGYGPSLPRGLGWQWPDSLYLELVIRGGIPLLVVLLGMMVVWGLRVSPLTSAEDPMRRGLGRVLMVLLLWLAIAHVIVPYFVDAGVPYMMFVLAALAFGGAATASAGVDPVRRAFPAPRGAVRARPSRPITAAR